MAYIIKNVTNKLDKRHPFANTAVEFNYTKGDFTNDVVSLNIGKEVIIEGELPISVHNLRIKGYISIKKISENELHAYRKKATKDSVKETVVSEPSKQEEKKIVKKNKS